jgi:pyruvyltransferase
VALVGESTEHVELGEAAWRSAPNIILERHPVHVERVVTNTCVEPPWIDEGRLSHEVVRNGPAEKRFGRTLPGSLATELGIRMHEHANSALAQEVGGSRPADEDAIRVDVADEVRVGQHVGGQLRDLLSKVVVGVVLARLEAGPVTWKAELLESRPARLRDDHENRPEAIAILLDRGEAVRKPIEISPVASDDDVTPDAGSRVTIGHVLERLHAFWCRIPSRANVGDALTPWLIRRLTGTSPIFARPDSPVLKYFVSGSVASYAADRCTLWGPGIMDRTDVIDPRATVLAVRGPLTRARALDCGIDCPDVYGDPALLLPRLYRPSHARRHGIGIVPHFADKPRLAASVSASGFMRLIDVQTPVETFVDRLASCEAVASSSLHGVIISHAYGIPAVWIKFRDLPSGDDSKFHDYFLSIGEEPPEPLRLRPGELDPDVLAAHARAARALPDLDRLFAACPFREPM